MDAGFGVSSGDPGVKTRLIQLISAVRVLLRSMLTCGSGLG